MRADDTSAIPPDLLTFIEGMPKAELHLHLEGSLEPELAFEIAGRNGIEPGSPEFPWRTVTDLKDAYHFDDLQTFLDVYSKAAGVLRTEADFRDLAAAYCRKARADNVLHTEVSFDPQMHTARGVPFRTVADAIGQGLREVDGTPPSVRVIGSILRDHPVGAPNDPGSLDVGFSSAQDATAWATVKQIVAYNDQAPASSRIVGLGLDNAEVGFPPTLFAEIYRYARENGLLATAHAGEEGPPAFVWEALDSLQCARIDHGVRSVEDANLVARLATPFDTDSIRSAYHGSHQVPLTVCPLSNYKLKVFREPADTNIVQMLDLGLQVTVNTDDPAYFGGYATNNYVFLLRALGSGVAKSRPIDLADIYRLCVNGFEGSWLTIPEKNRHIEAVTRYFFTNPGPPS